MPIFMDLHIAPGVTPKEVAEAHILDVKIQHQYCCKAMTYWIDEDKGLVFCLIEAPDKESVSELHKKAHGLVPHEVIQVNTDVVNAFLGRIKDPEHAIAQPETNLKIFSDPAFRIILVTRTLDARLLQHLLGKERTEELLLLYSTIIRDESKNHGGREVYLKEDGFVISFVSASQSMECGLAIQKKLSSVANLIRLRIGLHGGVPVTKNNSIFGDTIRFAQFLCSVSKDNQITTSSVVRNLYKENDWSLAVRQTDIRWLTTAEENFLENLIDTLDSHWHDPEFDLPDFCRLMSISKPQLYRKSISTTGMSPNTLLREYRLLQSLNLLRNEDRNISQTTFDTGFSSPSYFTKCFQKRFGLQPLAYLKTRA
jgi:AraC-like DNA-binding protein